MPGLSYDRPGFSRSVGSMSNLDKSYGKGFSVFVAPSVNIYEEFDEHQAAPAAAEDESVIRTRYISAEFSLVINFPVGFAEQGAAFAGCREEDAVAVPAGYEESFPVAVPCPGAAIEQFAELLLRRELVAEFLPRPVPVIVFVFVGFSPERSRRKAEVDVFFFHNDYNLSFLCASGPFDDFLFTALVAVNGRQGIVQVFRYQQ